jgi:hypothetical protein
MAEHILLEHNRDFRRRIARRGHRYSYGIYAFLLNICLLMPSVQGGLKLEFDPSVHGFVSQGYAHSSGQDFLLKDSGDGGSFELFEGAINLSNAFTPNVHASLQVLSRDLGEEGNHQLELDFGYVDYRVAPEFGLRVGKVRLPLGLYNEYRDIDAARNTVFLNQSLYAEDFRGFLNAYQGGGAYGSLESSKWSWLNLEYDLFGGTMSIPDDFFLHTNYRVDLNSPNFEVKPEHFYGMRLFWNAPWDGLRLGYTYAILDSDISLDAAGLPAHEKALDFDASQSVFSLQWQRGDWTVSAEKMSFLVKGEMSSEYRAHLSSFGAATLAGGQMFIDQAFTALNRDMEAWYVQLEMDTVHNIYPFISYGEYHEDKESKTKLNVRKDITIGFRYDFNEWLYAKIENHFMDGRGSLNNFNSTGKDHWNFFVARFALSF